MKFDRKAIESAVLIGALAITMVGASVTGQVEVENASTETVAQKITSGEASNTAGVVSDISGIVEDADDSISVEAVIEEVAVEQVATGQEAEEAEEEVIDEASAEWLNKCIATCDDNVNVRAEANTDCEIVGKMYAGAVADIVEMGDGWTLISSGDVQGYVCNDYLAFGLDAKELVEELGTWKMTTSTGGLRVRKEASSEGGIVTVLEEGDQLLVDKDAEEVEGWVAVIYGGNTRYVSAEYSTVTYETGDVLTMDEVAAKIAAEEAEKKKAKLQEGKMLAASVDETTLLAALIWCEAGNQPYSGQVAVGNVVVNRVYSGSYPNDMYSVIYQSGQFGPAGSGKLGTVLANGSYSSTAYQAACDALAGVNYIGSCLHFQSTSTGIDGIIIGGHVFY